MRIVPRNRLIAAGALLLPLTLAIPVVSEAAAAAAAAAALLAAAAAIDAVRGLPRLRQVSVRLPARVRAAKGRPAELAVEVAGAAGAAAALRIGLRFPRAVAAEAEADLRLPAGGGETLFRWPFLPREKGSFRLGGLTLEAPSGLGFWSLRREIDAASELRVYPNLARERRALPALFTRSGPGGHAARLLGQGREFEKLREYAPGDSYDEIHWKATARRSRPVTKTFQVERTQRVFALIDASRLSGRRIPAPAAGGGASESVAERFGTAALTLALAAERQGDYFGLALFDDRLRLLIPAQIGKAHFGAVREALATVEARRVTPDYAEVFAALALRLRRRSLLIILTQLEDPVLIESFLSGVEVLRGRHLVVAAMLRPPEAAPLFAAPDVETVEEVYTRLAGHLSWRRLAETERQLRSRRIGLAAVDSERLCAEVVGRYLALKRRQLL